MQFTPTRRDVRRRFCNEICRERNERRGQQARRRARRSGAVSDRINPIEVFERDHFRCYLCGVSTPREFIGTHHLTAPTMDHIVPLKVGGAHVWSNVACSCRKCNSAKCDKMPESLPLGLSLVQLYREASPRYVEIICLHCGEVYRYAQGSRGPLKKYCSTKCKDAHSHSGLVKTRDQTMGGIYA